MPPQGPTLASLAVLLRADGKILLVRHAVGPFAGRWSMPVAGVHEHETAEDALERMLQDYLHVRPGPYEFLDTIYLDGEDGERFVGNAFTCVDWDGEPRVPAEVYSDAVWAAPGSPGALDLLPSVRQWLAEAFEAETGQPVDRYDAAELRAALTDARSDLIAAFDAIPPARRGDAADGGWSPLDLLAHAADVEAYYVAETRRMLAQPGYTWRMFNDGQWNDLHRLRPADDEGALRARLAEVRSRTLAWLRGVDEVTLAAFGNHPERGVVQVGDRVAKVARHDREHTEQLRRMAAALEA